MRLRTSIAVVALVAMLLVGCGKEVIREVVVVATPIPATATPILPTATAVPPTATPVPATPVPAAPPPAAAAEPVSQPVDTGTSMMEVFAACIKGWDNAAKLEVTLAAQAVAGINDPYIRSELQARYGELSGCAGVGGVAAAEPGASASCSTVREIASMNYMGLNAAAASGTDIPSARALLAELNAFIAGAC